MDRKGVPQQDGDVARIYALRCPLSGEIRYVGRTKLPLAKRLSAHIQDARKRSAKAEWIRGLLARGLRPTIELMVIVPTATHREYCASWLIERDWVRMLSQSNDLLNVRLNPKSRPNLKAA